MTSVTMQRDLVISLKRETLLNVGILSKFHPMSTDLSRLLRENNLEKPTQNLFNHLSQYLVTIIDPQVSLSWPLYDTKTERTYRNQISLFIVDYSTKGLLSPVMSSYLVNPGCYKVVLLVFQMTQLAVQSLLVSKMEKDSQKALYNEMNENFKCKKDDGFIENLEKETERMLTKFSNHLQKRTVMETIAKKLRDRILQMEDKLKSLKAQQFIDNLVDGYLKKYSTDSSLDETSKTQILELKNVMKPATYIDTWLDYIDTEMTKMESDWDNKMSPVVNLAQKTQENTEMLISRQTGEADQRTFTIEYNPKTDEINTDELQSQVNMQQKYILKNITRDEKLSFPNLIRSFLISICYILKSTEISNEVYQFNEYLAGGKQSYDGIVNAMNALLARVMDADEKIPASPEVFYNSNASVRDLCEIPPLPDLSDLKMAQEYHPQMHFDPFTPLNNKHTFNLHKQRTGTFMKPPKVFVTPFHLVPKEDFLKSMSAKPNGYDNLNSTQNNFNLSMISQGTSRGNETIGGFSQQQICRLLSTKKSSSSKKFKHKNHRPDLKIKKKGALFNDSVNSVFSNESAVLFRSHSSPNLLENIERRSFTNARSRKLSIMREDSPSLLEVSGIAALERDSNHSTPQGMCLESSRKLVDATSLPSLSTNVTPKTDVSTELVVDKIKEIQFKEPQIIPKRRSKETEEERPQIKNPEPITETNADTPKTNPQLIKKTSSLEKIINRFKKVRASVIPSDSIEEPGNFKTIFEEKENTNTMNLDFLTVNRNLLPDLLSPNCSSIPPKSSNETPEWSYCDSDDGNKQPRKPRESLGAALGIDHTFLDQFDLID